ncbi:MAG: glycosyltransferase family 39 protein [Myxococcales bacterium]|nr:glycosyltransferase family 39 protein [Myxococcales bacterium]
MTRARLGPALEVLGLLALAGLAVWLRWPALSCEAFHNEDAAGITYNADLLRRGLVPMVDSLELKAPGSFFLSWLSWEVLGRSLTTLQQVACVWAILAAFGIYAGGRLLGGRTAAGAAALLYTLAAPITDSIDINYGAWMIMPYVWASVACLAALRSGRLRAWFLAGLVLALAGLFKRQAAVLFPLFFWVLLARHFPRPAGWAPGVDRLRGALALGAGLVVGFGTLGLYYLSVGELGTWIQHYFFSSGGWRYAAQTGLDAGEKAVRVGDGVLGFWEYMAVPSVLALATPLLARRGEALTVRGLFLAGHFALSFVGVAVGFRFFKSYYLQVLPAAVWIAVLPGGPLLRWRWRPRGGWLRPALLGAALLAVLVPAARHDAGQLRQIRQMRAAPRDADVQRIGRVIRANTDADDTIWVWGRWAWGVYFYTDRLAASRYYKVMGVLTTNLTNTWRRPTTPTRFVHGAAEDELMADLRRKKPAFIVVSHNEDYSDFKEFRRLLREDYRAVPHFPMRRFNVYHHKDHALREPPRPPVRRTPKPPKRAPTP